ncbi:MAG: hypothetical protein RLZZ500_2377 [Bacteroidota bacterium]|jgi:hypothetical protein
MKKVVLILIGLSQSISGQSVSNSVYSQFGLGSFYDADFGDIPSLGGSGNALPVNRNLNNLNPASLGEIGKNDFYFEIGGNGYRTAIRDNSNLNIRNNSQFSHIGIGFPVGKKSGLSFALTPYTSSRFQINNYSVNLGNSSETFTYGYTSTGGLSKATVNFGIKQKKYWNWGIALSALFGKIETVENFLIANSLTTFTSTSFYKGYQFQLGSQWKLRPNFTFGATLQFPSLVSASKTRSITTVDSNETSAIVTDAKQPVNTFNLPFQWGNGIRWVFKKNWQFTMDYNRSFWKSIASNSSYGTFKNQDVFAAGLFYQKQEENKRIMHFSYSAGIRYDTGYLSVNTTPVKNYSVSIGVGVPLDRTKTQLNINYSYGIHGTLQNELIRENYHKIGLILSYNGHWFEKRKFD